MLLSNKTIFIVIITVISLTSCSTVYYKVFKKADITKSDKEKICAITMKVLTLQYNLVDDKNQGWLIDSNISHYFVQIDCYTRMTPGPDYFQEDSYAGWRFVDVNGIRLYLNYLDSTCNCHANYFVNDMSIFWKSRSLYRDTFNNFLKNYSNPYLNGFYLSDYVNLWPKWRYNCGKVWNWEETSPWGK